MNASRPDTSPQEDGTLQAFFALLDDRDIRLGTWFSRLAGVYLERRAHRPSARGIDLGEAGREHAAERIIRRARWRSSAVGAAAGGVSTGAAVAIAELGAIGAIGGVPATALAIGGEMLYRALVHIEMCCDLGELYGVEFRADDPSDLWRLYALAFESGRGVVERPRFEVQRMMESETKEPSDVISNEILVESVLRNVLPVFGIGASAWRNWKLTLHVGETVHRYVRFRRNRREAFAAHESAWCAYLELIIESFWHVFTADGRISDEEVAILANYVERLPADGRARVLERFIDDEAGWLERLAAVPEADRDVVMHAMEHAATADMRVLPPERKLLERAARQLGCELDMDHVRAMIESLSSKA
ncbi:MAG: hypothetical protein K0S65_1338 [Labilithrix sp.]|nr:hypothetical protein [Labilithrix sp.]